HAGTKFDALGAHLLQAPIDEVFLQLEIRNPVTQQAADAVVLLEHRDRMTRARELLRSGEARGARADDGDALSGPVRGRLGFDPAFVPGLVDDGVLDRLDADRIL